MVGGGGNPGEGRGREDCEGVSGTQSEEMVDCTNNTKLSSVSILKSNIKTSITNLSL